MATPLRVLILEDVPADAELMLRELRRAGFDPDWVRVETESDYLAHVDPALDAILADYNLPQFDALRALRLLQERGLDIPFIIVTGSISEEAAVECMKQGVADYLLKDRLARLGHAVTHALEQKGTRDEKRRAEGQLRLQGAALESAANAIVITDPEGRMLWANPAFTRLTGYTPEETLGQNPRLLRSDKHDRAFYEHLWNTILSGQVWHGEIVNRRKDGSLYNEEMTITPVSDERGKIGHFIAIKQDVTERKRVEAALQAKTEEIRAMAQQLWQAAKLATMGELAASIAHELNNPLATVSLRVEALLGKLPEGDPARRPLEIIQEEIERMGNLVTRLLDFSRRSQSYVSSLDVREEIERTLELVQYHLRNRRVTVVREFAPAVPLIQADRQQVQQLFLNLFTNAADAMPEGGTLTLRVYQQAEGRKQKAEGGEQRPEGSRQKAEGSFSPEGRRQPAEGSTDASAACCPPPAAFCLPPSVVVEVADTGVGIAPADLPKVMEPFFTTKPEGKGTGLGLAICRRIVQEHGGTLAIASQPGQGTTVRVVLPVGDSSNSAHLREE